jgi:hypothetical protein
VFPVRYELKCYIVFRSNSIFKLAIGSIMKALRDFWKENEVTGPAGLGTMLAKAGSNLLASQSVFK